MHHMIGTYCEDAKLLVALSRKNKNLMSSNTLINLSKYIYIYIASELRLKFVEV